MLDLIIFRYTKFKFTVILYMCVTIYDYYCSYFVQAFDEQNFVRKQNFGHNRQVGKKELLEEENRKEWSLL